MKSVIISVEGGIVEAVEIPEGVKVILRDYDIQELVQGHTITDETGNYEETEL